MIRTRVNGRVQGLGFKAGSEIGFARGLRLRGETIHEGRRRALDDRTRVFSFFFLSSEFFFSLKLKNRAGAGAGAAPRSRIVLEPAVVPSRRERNRRDAHPSVKGLCCVRSHEARARSSRRKGQGAGSD